MTFAKEFKRKYRSSNFYSPLSKTLEKRKFNRNEKIIDRKKKDKLLSTTNKYFREFMRNHEDEYHEYFIKNKFFKSSSGDYICYYIFSANSKVEIKEAYEYISKVKKGYNWNIYNNEIFQNFKIKKIINSQKYKIINLKYC